MTPQRTAVVTGAGSGIGAAVSTALAADGWAVVLAGRRADALEDVAAGGRDLPGRMHSVPTDVTDEAQVDALFDAAVDRFGRVDLLFNNAGRFAASSDFDAIPVDEWRAMVDVNLTGSFLCARAAFRVMRNQEPARRQDHQQRIHQRPRAATEFRRLHGNKARDQRTHEIDRARRPRLRHRVLADRHRQRRNGHDQQLRGGHAAGRRQRPPGTQDGRCGGRPRGRLHGEPAARHERRDDDDHGDEDAVRRSGLNALQSAQRRTRGCHPGRWRATPSDTRGRPRLPEGEVPHEHPGGVPTAQAHLGRCPGARRSPPPRLGRRPARSTAG